MYTRTIFESMINDWIVNHAEEMEDLKICQISQTENRWEAEAQDDKTSYVLTDDGNGNICISYIGTLQ